MSCGCCTARATSTRCPVQSPDRRWAMTPWTTAFAAPGALLFVLFPVHHPALARDQQQEQHEQQGA